MATEESVAEYIAEQAKAAGNVRIRKMFGEFALYCDEKVVALICDNQLFVKPTESGKKFADTPELAPPYPGAKDFFVIEEHLWQDSSWLSDLIRITAKEVPRPKKKKPKK